MPDRELLLRIDLDGRYVADRMAAKIAAGRVPVVLPDLELLRHRLRYCPSVELVHADGRLERRHRGRDGGQLHAWSKPCGCCPHS